MCRLFNCGLWISVSLLLCGPVAFTSDMSTQNLLPNATVVKNQEDKEWDSPFLQLRASLPSYLQPIRPYTLVTHAEDYHHMPKPRHCRPSRLQRLLGSSFDPFWMSIDEPAEVSQGSQPLLRDGDSLRAKSDNYNPFKEKFNLSSSPELREATANHRHKLEEEAAELDLSPLPSDVASSVRGWLVRSAVCALHHRWVDLGPTFWPRWLRQTDCEKPDGKRSCSFPRGMECVRAQTTQLKILAWHCMEMRDGGDRSTSADGEMSDGGTEMERGDAKMSCLWRQVPYHVVTACMCSCK
ncbi:noggin-like [Mugil cephalus]|uniref:noggin-like n=1 Tax=Mugil cephalus TaxID=48193 RepID=UPI001FB65188|nr:noggin-like [Mugil cephalus]